MNPFEAISVVSASGNLQAMAATGAAAGIYFFYRGFRLMQRRRLILNTPASKIRSASMGLVEISGMATGPHVITSPLKQLDCFYYRSIAWEWKRQGKSSSWVKLGEETLHIPFYVDDGTGTLMIDPQGAEMDLHCDFREEYGSLFGTTQIPDGVSQFLSRRGANFDHRLKVEEYSICPQNFLFVLGTLAQNTHIDERAVVSEHDDAVSQAATAGAVGGPGHSRPLVDAAGLPLVGANYRQVVHLSGDAAPQPATEMTQQQRVAAALIKAGITNPIAWTAAGVTSQAAAQMKPHSPIATAAPGRPGKQEDIPSTGVLVPDPAFDPHPPVVLMKGTHDPTFFISWQSQRDVLSSLGWKSALMIWGGPSLTLVCVYALLASFNWH